VKFTDIGSTPLNTGTYK